MNHTLAALYGTGIEKTASEGEEIDLSQISAADFLAALEEVESEKVAGEDEGQVDLTQLSDEELLSLYNEMESNDTIEKMASSGELEYWDLAGRTMARAYADELEKEASSDEEFDLNEFSVQELIELGQELEKEAGMMSGMRSRVGSMMGRMRGAPAPKPSAMSGMKDLGAKVRRNLPESLRNRASGMSDADLGRLAAVGGSLGLGVAAGSGAAMLSGGK